MTQLENLHARIIQCRKCPRLVRWREEVAREKVRRYANEEYWGKPVPGFGDPDARLLIVGLAPAAHGGNRTGRMFTGDRSGDWLFRALHKAGFANQPVSVMRDDGLRLFDCYITATCRCAPPQNKLLPAEIRSCRPFLCEELRLLKNVRVAVGLGRIGFDALLSAVQESSGVRLSPKPEFSHGAEVQVGEHLVLIGSFHPSQQNTFTGRLTEAMLDTVFARARSILEKP